MQAPATAFLVAMLGACALNNTRTLDLATQFDCLRAERLTVVAAHRGQPDQSAAENALSSFATRHDAGVPFLEIGVATTRDDIYLADGNPSEYVDLARAGAVMIASDAAVIAQRAIGGGYRRCMR
jgi:hypothetical protein